MNIFTGFDRIPVNMGALAFFAYQLHFLRPDDLYIVSLVESPDEQQGRQEKGLPEWHLANAAYIDIPVVDLCARIDRSVVAELA